MLGKAQSEVWWILILVVAQGVCSSVVHNPALPAVTPKARLHRRYNDTGELRKRQIQTELSTCGYEDGDPKRVRSANSGFNCRVDTQNALWGFCPTTVIAATDCGLAGSCVDNSDCSEGCGATDSTQLTTFTCKTGEFCSTALLTFGVDQTYSYIACGAQQTTVHYLVSPTASSTSSSSKSESTSRSTTGANDTPEATSPPPDNEGDTGKSSNAGAIAGGVVGGLAVVGIFAAAFIYMRRRSRQRTPNPEPGELSGSTSGAELEGKQVQPPPKELPADAPHQPQDPVELPS